MRTLLFSLLCLSLLSGCEAEPDEEVVKPICPVKCTPVATPVSFSDHFFLEQLNNVVVRTYPAGCFWEEDSLLSLTTYMLADTTRYFFNDNTSAIGFSGLEIMSGYDYTIVFESMGGKTVWVSNVEEPKATEEVTCDKMPYECFRPIRDMTLTGMAYAEKISAGNTCPWHVMLRP